MAYARPTNNAPLTDEEKTELLSQYFAFYREAAEKYPGELIRKLPRSVLADSLDRIGAVMLEESRALAAGDSAVRRFLDDNTPPGRMGPLLPDDFRVFCLLLNALTQWVSEEQIAADGFLLGKTGRKRCRKMMASCLVTGAALDQESVLHHPVRDGRPPIPLSKAGHRKIEKQTGSGEKSVDAGSDEVARGIAQIRKKNESWRMLRRGCLLILGLPAHGGTKAGNANAKSLARRAIASTKLTTQDLLGWMDVRGLGSEVRA